MSSSTVIEINRDDPASIKRALETEWLLTNGLGGYAMGTLLGVNTRRYHGLLVAATKPPVGRIVALHSMIEQLIIPHEDAPGGEEVIDLSTQMFVGGDGQPMLHPQGWRLKSCFERMVDDAVVWWSTEINGTTFSKSVQLHESVSRIVMMYSVHNAPPACRLRLRPLIPLRDFHTLSDGVPASVREEHGRIIVERDSISLGIECMGNHRFQSVPQTWRNFGYTMDRQRGQDWTEHVWSPGALEVDAALQSHVDLWIECGPSGMYRWRSTRDRFAGRSDAVRALGTGGQDFVIHRSVKRESHNSIIAGYPWFSDWGRDTMIALPGLMLGTGRGGRLDEARSCLELFAGHLRHGLIPNFFDDSGGGVHYNTVDASLWFVHAVHAHWKATQSSKTPGQSPGLMAACRAIIAAYRDGTEFNIHMDRDDGLIIAGDETTQLTWMDAKRDGVVFTPRHGKAVEINALWINALGCMEAMTEDERERTELWALRRKAAASFRKQFWWPERGCLHDVLTPNVKREAASGGGSRMFAPDGKLRPNQILAVSLPFSALDDDEERKRSVVKVVGERLLTPFGLRTLDREDPEYRGRFEGNLFERDRAYHNGTVWPWLIGPYCEALLRVENFSASAKRLVRGIIQPLIDEMKNLEGGRCLGQIAEVYDGDPPHRPGGCPAQAWSVAEVLRVLMLVEDE